MHENSNSGALSSDLGHFGEDTPQKFPVQPDALVGMRGILHVLLQTAVEITRKSAFLVTCTSPRPKTALRMPPQFTERQIALNRARRRIQKRPEANPAVLEL